MPRSPRYAAGVSDGRDLRRLDVLTQGIGASIGQCAGSVSRTPAIALLGSTHVSQRVRRAVSINAPVEKVFAYLDVPANGLALIPQLVEVKEVVPLPNGGHRMRFVALGRRGKLCEWVSEHVERVPNERVVVRSHTDGVATTAVRRFEPTGEGARLSGEVEYRYE